MAMAALCPAVTLECGQPHLPHGVEHATDYLDTVLHLEMIKDTPIHDSEIDVYQTVARVTVPEAHSFSFNDPTADIRFDPKLDKLNFSELNNHTIFGQIQNDSNASLETWDDHEQPINGEYFVNQDNKIVLVKPVMPAMLTLDETIIRQDCLCYLMKRLELPA